MVDFRREAFGEVKAFSETEAALYKLTGQIEKLLDIIDAQEKRIEDLQDTVYRIAPEIEIIDTLADSESERQALTDAYMNHGEF